MIGVVVVSFQSATDLEACLTALLASEPPVRIVVVDNASSDGSPELVRQRFGSSVQLLALSENTGFAGGCNRGMAELGAEVTTIASINPDVRVQPDCLARCARTLEQDARLGALAPRLMRRDGVTVDSVGQGLRRRTLEVHDFGYGATLSERLLQPRPVLAACGALAVYRREALESVAIDGHAWAEEFFCFWEDLELGWRLQNRGWTVASCPQAVAVHGRGSGAEPGQGPLRWRRSVALEACILSNRWMTMIRHLHTVDLLLRLPVLLAWDSAAVLAGGVHRPRLFNHLRKRLPRVVSEWRRRGRWPRRRLRELPCWFD